MLAFLSSFGGPDTLVILLIALLLFGKRLPDIMRALGRSVTEFKRGMTDMTDGMSQSAPAVGDAALAPPAGTAPVQQAWSPPANWVPPPGWVPPASWVPPAGWAPPSSAPVQAANPGDPSKAKTLG